MKAILFLVMIGVVALHSTARVSAQDLIEEWATARLPAPPTLKPAQLTGKETALLVMDFTKQTCTPERRKRCSDSVPRVQKFGYSDQIVSPVDRADPSDPNWKSYELASLLH